MKINLPIKVHNKFEIEIKDVTTGEIVQKGYAENIMLDTYFTSVFVLGSHASARPGTAISFGNGQGTLESSRTSLFSALGTLETIRVELVQNQVPLPSYSTQKVVLTPESYVGNTLTEVGISNSNPNSYELYTHALIKDSAGNDLVLGPKTATQEITIYSTIYFVPEFDVGITLFNLPTNDLLSGFLGWRNVGVRRTTHSTSRNDDQGVSILFNDDSLSSLSTTKPFAQEDFGLLRRYQRFQTFEHNGKIKTAEIRSYHTYYSGDYVRSNLLKLDFPTLAENESSMWSGWEFDKTPIGVGDGATTEFPLPWDEAWLDKPKTIYVDGVATAVTWTEDTITFATAPVDQAPITGSYWVKYIPKDENHVLDITFDINYAEGVTT